VIGSTTLSQVLSGRGGIADVAAFALRSGFAVVLDQPGGKVPVCILGDVARRRADREARDQAVADNDAWRRETDPVRRAMMRHHPRPDKVTHACGIRHVLTADHADTVRSIVAAVGKRHGRINIGIEPGASRLVVVDVDTEAERMAYERWCRDHGTDAELTVQSPGKRVDGEWVHRDGGHYWYTLPEDVTLPVGPDGGTIKINGFSVVWANRQVLIPPSSRVEGDYLYTGAPVRDCPAPLIEAVLAYTEQRARQAEDRIGNGGTYTAIDAWDARTAWADVLLPDGWIDSGKIDNCGCPVWTAPGQHASYKSATAHDAGCGRYDTSDGWGPLHIWTDNPPEPLIGLRTLTKLDYLARMSGVERGDMATELGIGAEDLSFDVDHQVTSTQPADTPLPAAQQATAPVEDLFTDPGDPDAAPDLSPAEVFLNRSKSSAQLRAEPPLSPLIDGVLDKDATFRIVGPSGHGKTFVTLDMVASLATDQPWQGHATHADGRPVVYVVAEGAAGFKRRLWAWEQEYHDGEPISVDRLRIFDWAIQIKDQAGWRTFREALQLINPCLVVLDTQARVTVGMEENSATDMGIAVSRIDLIRVENPGCTAGTVHHSGYAGEHGRGSTAVYGSVTTEITIVKDAGGVITVGNPKQKDDAKFEPLTLQLRQVDIPDGLDRPAAVVDHGDPFETPVVRAVSTENHWLPNGAEWSHAVLAGIWLANLADRSQLDDDTGDLVPMPFTISEAKNAACGLINLPEVTVSRGRTLSYAQNNVAASAFNRMVPKMISKVDPKKAGYQLTESGREAAEIAAESCRRNV
jgi:hypothetical protein